MKKKFIIKILILLSAFTLYGQNKSSGIIPEPREYSFHQGPGFRFDKKPVEIIEFCTKDAALENAVNELSQLFYSVSKSSAAQKGRNTGKLFIGIPSENKNFKKLCVKRNALPDKKLGNEGYCLVVNPGEILISANGTAGLFYAIQSLKQVIRTNAAGKVIPKLMIKDWPAFKIRGVMDDISRGPVSTLDFMKYQIRRLAEIKINTLMYYTEHVVKTKLHPEFAPADGAVTIDEWKELSDYAAGYNIKLAGSFQSFGHFNNILSTPEYAHLGECGTLISPLRPESYTFLRDIYTEMAPAFSADFFNINCDETFDLGKGPSKRLVDSLGYAGTYFSHIKKLYDILKQLGRDVMLWGDVILEYPELLKLLPKDIIIGSWVYDDLKSYSKYTDIFNNAGIRYFAVPGVLNSNKLFPLYSQTFANISGFTEAAYKSNASGILNTVWDDGGVSLFSNDWYGVYFGAEKSWNTDNSDSSGFALRFNRGIHSADDNNYTECIKLLGKLAGLEATDGLNDQILFEKIVPDSGKTASINIDSWLKVLDVAALAEKAALSSLSGNYKDDTDALLFVSQLYKIRANERIDFFKAAEYYKQSLMMSDRADGEVLLRKAIDLIGNIIGREEQLKDKYEKLWRKENRSYSLNRITEKFNIRIRDYIDIKERISAVCKNYVATGILPSAESVRLAVVSAKGKYLRDWLAVNPIQGSTLQTDYLAICGGEQSIAPKVTEEFYYDSVKYRWSRISSSYPDVVDLGRIFNDTSGEKIIYAYATLESEKDTSVIFSLGYSGAIKIFVNGTEVFNGDVSGPIMPDQYKFPAALHTGINKILLKVLKKKPDYGFSLRLQDCKISGRKNRYKIELNRTQ